MAWSSLVSGRYQTSSLWQMWSPSLSARVLILARLPAVRFAFMLWMSSSRRNILFESVAPVFRGQRFAHPTGRTRNDGVPRTQSQGFRQSRFAQIDVPQTRAGKGAGRARQGDGRISRQTVA